MQKVSTVFKKKSPHSARCYPDIKAPTRWAPEDLDKVIQTQRNQFNLKLLLFLKYLYS